MIPCEAKTWELREFWLILSEGRSSNTQVSNVPPPKSKTKTFLDFEFGLDRS